MYTFSVYHNETSGSPNNPIVFNRKRRSNKERSINRFAKDFSKSSSFFFRIKNWILKRFATAPITETLLRRDTAYINIMSKKVAMEKFQTEGNDNINF